MSETSEPTQGQGSTVESWASMARRHRRWIAVVAIAIVLFAGWR